MFSVYRRTKRAQTDGQAGTLFYNFTYILYSNKWVERLNPDELKLGKVLVI